MLILIKFNIFQKVLLMLFAIVIAPYIVSRHLQIVHNPYFDCLAITEL